MFDVSKIKPQYSEAELKAFKNRDAFIESLVELHKQTLEVLWIIVESEYCLENKAPKELQKEEAVLAGNFIRLIKLNTSFLQNTCENKLEITQILNRCIAETCINIKYLLSNLESNGIRNYIKYSLITEKNLWETIKTNIAARDGESLVIEERMKNSIQNSFDSSDFEIDEVGKSSKWKSVSARAQVVGPPMFYNGFYGISSHAIHGNWQDILYNNLTKTENGFKINYDWKKSAPQMIDGPISLNLDVCRDFAVSNLSNHLLRELLIPKLDTLNNYHHLIMQLHETYLASKKKATKPNIHSTP